MEHFCWNIRNYNSFWIFALQSLPLQYTIPFTNSMSKKPPIKPTLGVPQKSEGKGSARARAEESNTSSKRVGDEAAFAIPLKVLRELLDRVAHSIFKVVTQSGSQGTGGLYAVPDDVDEQHTRCCFITCHHVLPTSARDEVSECISFFWFCVLFCYLLYISPFALDESNCYA